MENKVECFTAADAHQTYAKYGTTRKCKDGRGNKNKMDVYELKG